MFYKHLIHLRLKYNMKKFTYCVLFYVYNLNKLKKLFLYLNMNKMDYTYVSNMKYLSSFVFFQKLLIGSYLFVYTNNLEFLQKIEFEHFLQKIQISGILWNGYFFNSIWLIDSMFLNLKLFYSSYYFFLVYYLSFFFCFFFGLLNYMKLMLIFQVKFLNSKMMGNFKNVYS